MGIFRVTWAGYFDCEADNKEKAKNQFIEWIEENDIDQYGRDWKDFIECEELE